MEITPPIFTEKSIAVLPFVNMSSDPDNEYFSDGVTEEIINALTGIQGLKVIARTSSFAFKGKNIDVRTIGKQLAVTTVLEGSVRKVGQRIRVTAQLVRTDDGSHLWSKNFDRKLEDIFATQDEISLLIADQIRANFGHFDIGDKLYESHTDSVDAYRAYLKGRFHQLKWSIEHYKQAIDYYKEALAIDPNYPMPYYGLVQCYTYLFMWRAISKPEAIRLTDIYLDQLKAINPQLAEYHLARSGCAILLNWDLQLAHDELKKTLAISPANVDALEALAGLYIVVGAFEESIQYIDQAIEVNPLSANHSFMKGNSYYYAGAYKKAIKWMDVAIKLEPNMLLARQVKMATLLLLDRQAEFERYLDRNKAHSFAAHFSTLQRLMQGGEDELALDEDHSNAFLPWQLYFLVHSGQMTQAFSVLREGLSNQEGQYFCFKYDPFLKPLREDERFQEVLQAYPDFSLRLAQASTPPNKLATKKMDDSEATESLSALERMMEKEAPYLNPVLSIKLLSEALDIHPNKLSWLINEHFEKNFNEYINSFRLSTFKAKALDPANSHLTLLGLAYESGFNSKTVFNAFFKKTEGITPRAWVKAQSKE